MRRGGQLRDLRGAGPEAVAATMQEIIASVDHIKFDLEIAVEQQLGAQPLPFPGMDSERGAQGRGDADSDQGLPQPAPWDPHSRLLPPLPSWDVLVSLEVGSLFLGSLPPADCSVAVLGIAGPCRLFA